MKTSQLALLLGPTLVWSRLWENNPYVEDQESDYGGYSKPTSFGRLQGGKGSAKQPDYRESSFRGFKSPFKNDLFGDSESDFSAFRNDGDSFDQPYSGLSQQQSSFGDSADANNDAEYSSFGSSTPSSSLSEFDYDEPYSAGKFAKLRAFMEPKLNSVIQNKISRINSQGSGRSGFDSSSSGSRASASGVNQGRPRTSGTGNKKSRFRFLGSGRSQPRSTSDSTKGVGSTLDSLPSGFEDSTSPPTSGSTGGLKGNKGESVTPSKGETTAGGKTPPKGRTSSPSKTRPTKGGKAGNKPKPKAKPKSRGISKTKGKPKSPSRKGRKG